MRDSGIWRTSRQPPNEASNDGGSRGKTTKPSPPAQDPTEADAWAADVEDLVTQTSLGFVIFIASLSGGGADARHMVSLPGAKTGRQAGARPPAHPLRSCLNSIDALHI